MHELVDDLARDSLLGDLELGDLDLDIVSRGVRDIMEILPVRRGESAVFSKCSRS